MKTPTQWEEEKQVKKPKTPLTRKKQKITDTSNKFSEFLLNNVANQRESARESVKQYNSYLKNKKTTIKNELVTWK